MRGQTERADASDRMARDLNHILTAQHAWLGTESRPEFLVIKTSGAGHDDDHRFVAGAQTYAFGNLIGFDPMGGGGHRHRRGTGFGDDHFNIGGVFGEKGLDGRKTHFAKIAHESFLGKPGQSHASNASLRCKTVAVF
jgi:hypothetical protein